MAAPVPLIDPDEARLTGASVGYFTEHPGAPVTPETKAAVERVASALRDCGFRVEPFLPDVLTEAQEHWRTLFVRLGAELLAPEFQGREAETSTILTYSDRPPTKEELLAAWFRRDQLRLSLMQQMSSFPVLICPVCSVPAFRHGERTWNIAGRSVSYMDAMSYTQWFNLLGNPAIVLPVGESPEGLPIGVQIIGQPNSEELILKMGIILERTLGPRRQSPMMVG